MSTRPSDGTQRTRRRGVRSVLANVLLVPVWVLVAFISIHSLAKYSDVANLVLLAAIMFFAAGAWWYCEDRDRRRDAERASANGKASDSIPG